MNNVKTILTGGALLLGSLTTMAKENPNFDYKVDRFADIEVLRYEVPGFDQLTLQQKEMLYYLSEAAQWGRDIIWDQNGKNNLKLRLILEKIYQKYDGDRDSKDWKAFEKYMKQVWFGNGPHHHYSNDKFVPEFSQEFFEDRVKGICTRCMGASDDKERDAIVAEITRYIFDPSYMPKKVSLDSTGDVITASSVNLYDGVTQEEVEAYFAAKKKVDDPTPISYGLNSKLVKDARGNIHEETYCLNGLYGDAIRHIIYWLDKAKGVAENDAQRAYITKLIDYYITGDLRLFDEYSILWAEDSDSDVDFVNGFIESYNDPLGMTGSWESYVNFRNRESTKRTKIISDNAQWFEDNAPIDAQYRKPHVKGISAKAINAVMLAGDAYPATAIGINLPNADWIRAQHGSKSVTIENITEAYAEASKGNGFREEFVIDAPTRALMDKYLYQTDMLHTDLHECLGHASGQLAPGTDPDALKENGSTLEEARADLFALYYLADPKLVELGIISDPEAYKAEYYQQMMNGLMTQLNRIEPGNDVEEAHMRNRQLIAAWTLDHAKKSKAVQLVKKGGKTYLKINDYNELRNLFGQLLKEIQRIKSTGDYAAGNALVQKYAVKVDPKLHKEVLQRYSTLDIPPYRGFVNPVYVPEYDAEGNITDVKVTYNESYPDQMLRLSRNYSALGK
ncbi:MAG: dipeptidyl peptidase 3 [Muribaculaceae bacterium]|nr:dipeptidyl peptidase 3 [Muribaculaceae bacterium]